VLQHPDLETLAREQEPLMGWLANELGLVGVRSDLKLNKPQLLVRINRDRAATLDVSVTDISNTMRFLLGEPDISEIERKSERYEIIPEILGKGTLDPAVLRTLHVRAGGGPLVPLADLLEIEERAGPSEIPHFNRIRAATIAGSTPAGMTLGDVMEKARVELERRLPAGFEYTFTGESQDLRESFYYLTVTIVFSIVLVYLILSAQFESFYHPFTILLTLPLASVGAFGALWVFGMPFGIVAFIGVIMLVGMATKNAILMVDYTNVLMARGRSHEEAAREAAQVRFRPVVMTTVSTVLGIMPIALGYGAGGEARAPMGVAVASGLLATTALTLLVIPVVFTLFEKIRHRIFNRSRRQKEA